MSKKLRAQVEEKNRVLAKYINVTLGVILIKLSNIKEGKENDKEIETLLHAIEAEKSSSGIERLFNTLDKKVNELMQQIGTIPEDELLSSEKCFKLLKPKYLGPIIKGIISMVQERLSNELSTDEISQLKNSNINAKNYNINANTPLDKSILNPLIDLCKNHSTIRNDLIKALEIYLMPIYFGFARFTNENMNQLEIGEKPSQLN